MRIRRFLLAVCGCAWLVAFAALAVGSPDLAVRAITVAFVALTAYAAAFTTVPTGRPDAPAPTDQPTGRPDAPAPTDQPTGRPDAPAPTDQPTGPPATPTGPPTRPPMVAAYVTAALAVVAFTFALPALGVESEFGWFAYAPAPGPSAVAVARAVAEETLGMAPVLLSYAALAAAIAALPRYRRPALGVAGAAPVVVAVAYAVVVGRSTHAPAGQLVAVESVPFLVASFALAGTALATQRLPGERARAVPVAAAGVGMLLLAVPPLLLLEPVVAVAWPTPTARDPATVPPMLATSALGDPSPAVTIQAETVPRFPAGPGVYAACWLVGLALVVWGCLRATRHAPTAPPQP